MPHATDTTGSGTQVLLYNLAPGTDADWARALCLAHGGGEPLRISVIAGSNRPHAPGMVLLELAQAFGSPLQPRWRQGTAYWDGQHFSWYIPLLFQHRH